LQGPPAARMRINIELADREKDCDLKERLAARINQWFAQKRDEHTESSRLAGPPTPSGRANMNVQNTMENNFNGLRLLGAGMVLIGHQFALSGRPQPLLLGLKLGSVGVLIFFAISGFLVTASWRSDPHVLRFSARRLLRVWPALAVCVIACIAYVVLVIVPHEERSAVPAIVASMLPNLAFEWRDAQFFQANPSHYINGSLWTIPIEVRCYAALALLGLAFRARIRLGLVVVAAAALGMALLDIQPFGVLDSFTLLQRHDSLNLPVFFLAGALVCVIPALQDARAAALTCVLAVLCALGGFTGLCWALALPVLVLQVGSRSWPVLRRAARWGDLSYGVYLWAWPVQQVGIALLGEKAPFMALLGLTVTAVLSLALLSWHMIEKRSLRLKPMRRSLPQEDVTGSARGTEALP
jgi:peptidoglycan/LPS O-acetylase OafA/YrhL